MTYSAIWGNNISKRSADNMMRNKNQNQESMSPKFIGENDKLELQNKGCEVDTSESKTFREFEKQINDLEDNETHNPKIIEIFPSIKTHHIRCVSLNQ
mmetsp:Transcript_45648/g.33380  ORF Transcript_45648/g.33380 Transcript_45648/m.33380 type:complete len:98 (+) Transcript_45648:964-1257(+)